MSTMVTDKFQSLLETCFQNKVSKDLSDSLDRLGNTAQRIKNQRDFLVETLHDVRELIEGYVDVVDGDYGEPAPNNAMRAVSRIDEAIAQVES